MEAQSARSWYQLCLEHEAFLLRLARDLVRDTHQAEDLVQQTWLRAIERPPTRTDSPRGWLATVLRNSARDWFRGSARSRQVPEIDPDAIPGRAPDADPLRADVSSALADLDPIYHDILTLHYIEGLTMPTVARRLRIPLETARTRLKRALQTMRYRLDREGVRDWRSSALALLRMPGPPAPSNAPIRPVPLVPRFARVALLLCLPIGLVGAIWWGGYFGQRPALAAQTLEAAEPQRSRGVEALSGPELVRVPASESESSPAVPGDERVAFELRVLDQATGEAKVGLAVLFQPEFERPRSGASSIERATDATGIVRVSLSVGRWTIRPELGGALVIDVDEQAKRRLDWSVPAGVDVQGRVYDSFRRPVAGAQIVSTWAEWDSRVRVVAVTDEEGRFRLEDADRKAWLGARGPEFSISPLTSLSAPREVDSSLLTVDLELVPAGPALVGLVMDSGQQPIEDASILIRRRDMTLERELVWGVEIKPLLEAVHTGPDGVFELRRPRLDGDRLTLVVGAPGYATEKRVARISSWTGTPLVITLRKEAVLEGNVVGMDGQPAAGVLVRVSVPGFSEGRVTRSDASGRYRVDELPPGLRVVSALSDNGQRAGFRSLEVRLDEGRLRRCNLELERRRPIRGVALAGDGTPLAGWVVRLEEEDRIGSRRVVSRFDDNRSSRTVRTDENGGFAFFGCQTEGHVLKLYSPEDAAGFPTAFLFGIEPPADVTLSNQVNLSPTAVISGQLYDDDGRAPLASRMILFSRLLGRRLVFEVDPVSGLFETDLLPPSTYEVQAWIPPNPPIRMGEVELEPLEMHDMGLLHARFP